MKALSAELNSSLKNIKQGEGITSNVERSDYLTWGGHKGFSVRVNCSRELMKQKMSHVVSGWCVFQKDWAAIAKPLRCECTGQEDQWGWVQWMKVFAARDEVEDVQEGLAHQGDPCRLGQGLELDHNVRSPSCI